MVAYAFMRLLQALATLFVASIVIFGLGRLTGNPVDTLLPLEATPAQRVVLIEKLGLDRSIVEQYWLYLSGILRGDFGESFRTGRPVIELVAPRLWNSLQLASASLGLIIALSVPLGVVAAVNRGRFLDKAIVAIASLGISIPSWWFAIVMVLVFSVALGWLPTSGMGDWRNFVMPTISLSLFTSAGVVRLLRGSMLEVLDSEFVKFGRSYGLRESRVIWKHALRNALVPVFTFVTMMYGILIAFAITTEVVFAWPGIGRLAFEAVLWRDFPLLQFTVLTIVSLVLLLNFLVDIGYAAVDPRIRINKRG